MFVPSAFKIDRASCLAFAAARGFGLVIGQDGARPVVSSLPFNIAYAADGTPHAQFHVARGNPLAALAARGGEWMIAVAGADAYVSPLWYVSHDQVPTWLYESVQLTGHVRLVPPSKLRIHLDTLTERFETSEDVENGSAPWTLDKVTAARREMLLQAIVGIEMEIEIAEGSAKLNQTKSEADYQAVAMQLRRSADPMAQRIAARMIALKSHLPYEDESALKEANDVQHS